MTTNTMTIEEIVARRVYISEQIDRLTEEKQQIDAQILERYQTGNHDAGDWTLQVKAGAKRLNNDRFAERFPVTAYPHLYEPKPAIAKIKEFFAPVDLEQFMDQNKSSVGVK